MSRWAGEGGSWGWAVCLRGRFNLDGANKHGGGGNVKRSLVEHKVAPQRSRLTVDAATNRKR